MVRGVGINDESHKVKSCQYYRTWERMLQRCYSKEHLKRFPTYIDCVVDPSWIYFSNFKKWMESQDWNGKQLDKDLLVSGNRIYGPETCVFVSSRANKLMMKCGGDTGDNKLGVLNVGLYKDGSVRYRASCNSYGKSKYLGVFRDINLARAAYIDFKVAYLLDFARDAEINKTEDEKVISAIRRIAMEIT